MEAETHFFSGPEFWILIAFIIFIGIMLWVKLPAKIAATLDARAEKIKARLDEARNLKEEAQSLLAQYQRKHRDAEKDAKAMIVRAQEEAENFAREAGVTLEESFARQVKNVEDKIAQAEASAVAKVKSAATELAIDAARRILSEELAKDQSEALTDAAIEDIEKRLN